MRSQKDEEKKEEEVDKNEKENMLKDKEKDMGRIKQSRKRRFVKREGVGQEEEVGAGRKEIVEEEVERGEEEESSEE